VIVIAKQILFRKRSNIDAYSVQNGTLLKERGVAEGFIIRAEWLRSAVNWCQRLVGQFMLADINDLPAVMTSALHDSPACVNQGERLVLRSFLLDLGVRLVRHVHSHEDVSMPCPCGVENIYRLMSFWVALERDVAHCFAAWIDALVGTYNRTHPPTLAERAARFIRQCASERMGAARIATECGCTLPTLRQAFGRRYGVSLREYQDIARVMFAVSRVRSGIKIETVAVEAGYRSKKDFYKVFRHVIGLTPVQFRNLPSSEAVRLVSDARSRLVLRPRRRQQNTWE
jgi:AraC-like DNA-binding protein